MEVTVIVLILELITYGRFVEALNQGKTLITHQKFQQRGTNKKGDVFTGRYQIPENLITASWG